MKNEEDSSKESIETGSEITPEQKLGDFTTTLRIVPISLLAKGIGVLCAFVALALLRLGGVLLSVWYRVQSSEEWPSYAIRIRDPGEQKAILVRIDA